MTLRKEDEAAGFGGDRDGGDDVADISAGRLLTSSKDDAASRGRLLPEDFMDGIQGEEQL